MPEISLLGQLAIDLKKITPEQLEECLVEQRATSAQLGAVMVKKGFIDFATLLLLLKLQDKKLDERSRHSAIRKRDNLFGRVAVEYGFCTEERMNEALRLQAENPGAHGQLGELLVKQGWMTEQDVRLVLEIQDKRVLLCRTCRTQYNVAGYRAGQEIACTSCGAVLAPASPAEHRQGFKHGTTIIGVPGKEKGQAGRKPHFALPARASTPTAEPEAVPAAPLIPATPGDEDAGQVRTKIGRYELIAPLGRGPHSEVYKAWDREGRRAVAAKLLTAEITAEEVALFSKAAAATKPLDHPNLARVLEYGEEGRRLWVVSEFVEGRTLRAALPEIREDLSEILESWMQIARGIAHAHEKGVLHRDLKPENVLLDDAGVLKVTDFGLAVQVGSAADEDDAGQRIVLGTAPYMSPEQAAGDLARHGPPSDVYGLGAVAYELYTGQPPHQADTLPVLLERVQHADLVPPRRLRPDLPAAAEAIVLKCLAREPAERYPDAGALLADLERLRRGEPVQAAAATAAIASRRLAWTAIAAAAAVGLALFLWRWMRG